MKTLSIADFPLYGQSLIEASAGTGKTFTITGLYNRLMLGHGRPRLGCDQILVVTFTRAATEELRGRIRQRLRDTLEDLLSLENGQPIDEQQLRYLQQLAAAQNNDGQHSEGQNSDAQHSDIDAVCRQLKPWLQSNLALMDEAAIYTIHGFCQRMLKQFAFDSGVVFSAELVLDSDSYLQQACEDIWRQQAYTLDEPQGRYLISRYAGPDDVLAKVRSRISRPDMTVVPAVSAQGLSKAWHNAEAAFMTAKAAWSQISAADVVQLIADSGLDKKSYSKRFAPNWVAEAAGYFGGRFYMPAPKNLYRMTPTGMAEKLKDSGELPQHAAFDATEDFLQAANQLALLLEAAWMDAIKERYFELLEKAGALTPDDLLRLLVNALRAEQGELLASHIRRLYPLAMIDEFQDTDPQQYEIFNRIYPPQDDADNALATQVGQKALAETHGLIMIGDPKQAIYGFRGADIFTYIKARRQLDEERRFTLEKNWRSHSQLVAGVNQIFAGHDSPFVFDQDIQFVNVSAAGKPDGRPLKIGDEEQTPLQLWHDGEEYSRARAQFSAAEQCAEKIDALMHGDATLGDEPVQARDIAVLVRSRKQAGLIREALSARQIGSVFLTRDSVYDSLEARDLFAWLQAVAHPSDERALRTAMATETQGLTAAQLDALLNDEQAWERTLEQNHSYHQLWQRRGVMAAIMQWLEEDGRAQRLRRHQDGERRITNLMHLGELLQSAARRLRGHEALLRWFGEHIFSDNRSGDEAQLRLESDANLVTIVTIHKSKGLEYPLVFLPFLWDDSYLPNPKSDTQYFSETDGMVLNLEPDDEAKALAVRDSLAESLRLLYVALTRAVQGCFIWLTDAVDGKSKKEKKSRIAQTALGYLLAVDNDPDWAGLKQSASGECLITDLPEWPTDELRRRAVVQEAPQAAVCQPHSWDSWRVSSYSQLTADDHSGHTAHDDVLVMDESSEQTDSDESVSEFVDAALLNEISEREFDATAAALTFAKGANAGTCLHAIFEHWDFVDSEALHSITERELSHYGLALSEDEVGAEEKQKQIDEVAGWMQAVVNSPLMNDQGEQFSLADISAANRLDEMEFYLPVQQLQAADINRLLADPAKGGRFHFDTLSGYLKGFIDLIFCHNGRYYVADYKSNHLGFSINDYTPAALIVAMADHQYDLQAWLYTVALDQLLRQRLPGYDPAQHLGGVYYFWLRGMHLGDSAPRLLADDSAASQQDLFAAPALTQVPGVYYHAVDIEALQRWRQVLLPDAVCTRNSSDNKAEAGV
ncbi:exodeoxyribonuclease V subunit beta [Thalassolituus marinus]|uniref:RecBCD enzyme subunit RecB n=1 Tax=Thalassolituus marinus TaxID=671053 RepID=A0ABS7ZMN9_9GAMM|nr:exodeoxyribonuclease V subunit beta [Thalassolituus marinus]MCA6062974.1 exodeoxyribonuclease V subunit beta [Thalassolituus marinus]